jgi:hypothetical protein
MSVIYDHMCCALDTHAMWHFNETHVRVDVKENASGHLEVWKRAPSRRSGLVHSRVGLFSDRFAAFLAAVEASATA